MISAAPASAPDVDDRSGAGRAVLAAIYLGPNADLLFVLDIEPEAIFECAAN